MADQDPFANAALPQAQPTPAQDPFANAAQPMPQTPLPAGISQADVAALPAGFSPENIPNWGYNLDENLRRARNLLAGGVKGAGQTAAGVLDLAASPAGATIMPGATVAAPQLRKASAWIRQHSQVHDNPEQQAGYLAESVLELMALPELKAEQAVGAVDKFGQAAKLAKVLNDNPKILTATRLGLNTMRAAGELGGQTYLRTQDVGEAAKQAALGGATAAVLSAPALAKGTLAARGLEEVPVPPRRIAGVDIPTSIPTEAEPALRASIPPGGLRPASEQVEQAVENIGQQGLRRSLERSNTARLPDTPPPPGTTFTIPAREPTIVTPLGPMNIGDAHNQIIQDWKALRDPANQGAQAQRTIRDRIDNISGSIRDYNQWAAQQPNFPLHDIDTHVSRVTDLETAGQLAMEARAPFYEKMNAATDGEFMKAVKNARRISRSTTASEEDIQAAQDRVEELFQQNQNVGTRAEWEDANKGYREGIAMSRLGRTIEAEFERGAGITKAEVARQPSSAASRTFTPTAQFGSRVDSIYKEFKPELDRTIGEQSVLDIKELGVLFRDPETRAASNTLLNSISQSIRLHGRGLARLIGAEGVVGGAAGYASGHAISGIAGGLGVGVSSAVAGGTIMGYRNYIIGKIATDPAFARRFIYSVTNNVSSRTAGPLLAARLIGVGTRGPSSALTSELFRSPEETRAPEDTAPTEQPAAETPRPSAPPGTDTSAVGEDKWGQVVSDAADRWNLDRHLAAAVVQKESSWDPHNRSETGALGLGQFTEGTGRQYGLNTPEDRKDPYKNADATAHYLADLMARHNNNMAEALKDYFGREPYHTPAQQQAYANRILREFRQRTAQAGAANAGNE